MNETLNASYGCSDGARVLGTAPYRARGVFMCVYGLYGAYDWFCASGLKIRMSLVVRTVHVVYHNSH